jgi:monothiol glutaredoxin
MSSDPATHEKISALVKSNPVMLFMKGTREVPQCGFSAQVVTILERVAPEYTTFDVLADQTVREGIKEFSRWPTVPQLYVRGEFIGGCDIITEMFQSGELSGTLSQT